MSNRLVDASCGLIEGEDAFYNRYRQLLDIEAPRCFLATYDRVSFNSIVVLEDLTLRGVTFCDHDTVVTRELAETQMSLLARLHGSFWEGLAVRDRSLWNFRDEVGTVDQWFDLKVCCTRGFEVARDVTPPRLYERADEIWPATERAFDLHASMPRTLTHNDPHLRNWYLTPERPLALTDWQTFATGDWGRDVGYTISTCLTTENRRAWEHDLLRLYLDELAKAGGPTLTFDEAWTSYRRHLCDALAWWTLTIALSSGQSDEPPPDFQSQAASLAFIGRMATAIDDCRRNLKTDPRAATEN